MNARKIIDKLKQITNVKTDQEIAEILELNTRTFRGWIQRDSIQHEIIVDYALKNNIDLNSLYAENDEIKQLSKTNERAPIEKDFNEVVFTAFKQAHDIAEKNDWLEDLAVYLMKFPKVQSSKLATLGKWDDPRQATKKYLLTNYDVEDIKKFETYLEENNHTIYVGAQEAKSVLEFIEFQIERYKKNFFSADQKEWEDILHLYHDRDIYILRRYIFDQKTYAAIYECESKNREQLIKENKNPRDYCFSSTFKSFLDESKLKFLFLETNKEDCYSLRNICEQKKLISTKEWDLLNFLFEINLDEYFDKRRQEEYEKDSKQ